MVFRLQVEVSFNINHVFLEFYLFCSLIFVNNSRRGSTYQSAGSKVLCQRMPLWLQLEIAFHLQERITTATKRGSTRGGRGRGRAGAPRNPKSTEQGSRGRGKRKRGSVPADQATSSRRRDAAIPDLNETIPEQEAQAVPVTQNAPTQDDFWF
jgi:hypothetical protein